MQPKRILITGASGCLGHYISDQLLQTSDAELFLLVRDPAKLKLNLEGQQRVTVIQGDMLQIADHTDLLATINVAILTATAWGGPQTYQINIEQTETLISLLNPDCCEQVIYFSTASVLNRQMELIPEAETFGTEYIRSKYLCLQRLPKLALADRITTVFPTLVFGGTTDKPFSEISKGFAEIFKWAWLLRWFKGAGSAHFMHGQDTAQVIGYLVQHPELGLGKRLVLGQPEITLNHLISEICAFKQQRIFWQLDLTPGLINLFFKLFRVQTTPWDYFCLQQRYFGYDEPLNPQVLGLPVYCPTVANLLKITQADLASAGLG